MLYLIMLFLFRMLKLYQKIPLFWHCVHGKKVLHICICYFQIAELVATEFYDQGDKERQELKTEPIVSIKCTDMLLIR